MAGVSIAARLAPHRRVAVLEAEDVLAFHATGRSAAMYVPSYGVPAVQTLTRASGAFFHAPPPDFTDGPLLTPRPVLHVASARLKGELYAKGEAAGLRPVTADRAAELAPGLRRGAVGAAVLDDASADIDVDRLFQGFLRAARRAGADLYTGAGEVVLGRAGGKWTARGRAWELRAPVVVNAAGAWADRIASRAGVRPVGLRPLRRTMVLAEAAGTALPAGHPVVMDVRERFYFKPEAGGVLLTGCDETPSVPCDAGPEEIDVARGVHRVQAVLAFEIARVRRAWAGLRTFAADRAPVVGYAPDAPGFFWFAGLGGFGVQTAPALSERAASRLLAAADG